MAALDRQKGKDDRSHHTSFNFPVLFNFHSLVYTYFAIAYLKSEDSAYHKIQEMLSSQPDFIVYNFLLFLLLMILAN